jgi:serine/threonine protein kinase
VELLGSGSFGKCFKVRHPTFNKIVAIKIMKKGFLLKVVANYF